MQQLANHLAVMHIGRCGHDGVDDLLQAVDAKMRLFARLLLAIEPICAALVATWQPDD